MSAFTVALYFVAIGLWVWFIHLEGGIGAGVRFMYAFNLIHQFLIGPPLYAVSGLMETEAAYRDREAAVELVLYSMIAFAVGAYLLPPVVLSRPRLQVGREWKKFIAPDRLERQWKVARMLVIIGACATLSMSVLYRIPTMRAIGSQLNLLLDTGLTMMCIYIMLGGRRERLSVIAGWLVASTVFRALSAGFFGNSATTALFLLAILTMARRSSLGSWLSLAVTLYCLLIPYGIWMGIRPALRASIARNDSFEERLNAVDIQSSRSRLFFNIFDPDDIKLIEHRIDQSHLLAAAMRHTPAREPFAWGRGIVEDTLVALVPRFLWPDKPLASGGADFVSRYTGLQFGKKVSVGVNYLFEFYVNFGTVGALLCVLLMGLLCGVMDYQFFARAPGNLCVEWTILLCMWSICAWSDRIAQLAMTLPVAAFTGWMLGRVFPAAGWDPVVYTPPKPRRPPSSANLGPAPQPS